MSTILLAIDVGNTRIKLGLFERSDTDEPGLPACLYSNVLPHGQVLPWGEIASHVHNQRSDELAAVIAGTRPAGIERVIGSWPSDQWPLPNQLGDASSLPLRVSLDAADKVGIDRLLNAVAVNAMKDRDRPAFVVDCGTATTVDYITADGAFAGGAILPGFQLCARSLHHYTALLPWIPIEELTDIAASGKSPVALGRSTREAMHSGLFWGQLGAIRELVARMRMQLTDSPHNASTDPASERLFLTGGGARLLLEQFPGAQHEPHLALQGLALATGHCD